MAVDDEADIEPACRRGVLLVEDHTVSLDRIIEIVTALLEDILDRQDQTERYN